MIIAKPNREYPPMNTTGLTADQAQAARTLDRYQAEGAKLTALLGYAGTGKTELAVRRIQHVVETQGASRVLVVAPTHKARSNIWNKARGRVSNSLAYDPTKVSDRLGGQAIARPNDSTPWYQVKFDTVSRALGKQRFGNHETGETYFDIRVEPEEDPTLDSLYTHCFIDEVSMIGEHDWDLLQRFVFPYCTTEVIGDPAQLPPVNDGVESPAFQIPHKATLR
jgi:hypothetical protein